MLPIINLDDENFDDIIEKAIHMIANVYPEWTDYNDHDPGITFLNLFAWLKEMQQYHLNQIGQHNYFKYLKLLGMEINKKKPATTMVLVNDIEKEFTLPKGSVLSAGEILFETMQSEVIVKECIQKLVSYRKYKKVVFDYMPNMMESKLRFYLFGTEPEKENEFHIGFMEPLSLGVIHSIYLDIFDDYPVKRNKINEESFFPLTELKFEYYRNNGWEMLPVIKDETYQFIQSGRIYFKLQEEMERLEEFYWIKVTFANGEYDVPPILQGLSMNMIPVQQVETLNEYEDFDVVPDEVTGQCQVFMNTALAQTGNHEVMYWDNTGFVKIDGDLLEVEKVSTGAKVCFSLPPSLYGGIVRIRIVNYHPNFAVTRRIGLGDGFPNQKFQWSQNNLVYDSFEIMVEDELHPGSFLQWEKVDDFDCSTPEDRHYQLEEEEGILIFGDCEHGRAPEGIIELISCKKSLGLDGNVKAEKMNQFTDKSIQASVLNYENATNGTNRESIEMAMNRFKLELRRIERAVTYADYEKLTLATPGLMIRNTKAISISQLKKQNESLDENCVTVVVQPYSTNKMQKLSTSYHKNIIRLLNQKRMVGTRVKVISPEYIGVTIFAEIETESHYSNAEQMIRQAIEDYLGKKSWDFGSTVLYSTIYGIIDTLKCVVRIQSLSIDAQGRGISRNMNGDILIPANGLVYLKEAIYSISTAN